MRGVYNELTRSLVPDMLYEDEPEVIQPVKRRKTVTQGSIVIAVGAGIGLMGAAGAYIWHEANDYGRNSQIGQNVAECKQLLAQQPNVHSTQHLQGACQKLANRLPSATEYVTKSAVRIYSWTDVNAFVDQGQVQPIELHAQETQTLKAIEEVGVVAAVIGGALCATALYYDERRKM